MSRSLVVGLALIAAAAFGELAAAERIIFQDVTDETGLGAHLKTWTLGHGAAWGDADGDGRVDLYIGAFADHQYPYSLPGAPIPNQLFLGGTKGFVLSPDEAVRLMGKRARTTAAIFVDLDNDGDLDLFVSNHGEARKRQGPRCQSLLLENVGKGRFRDRTPKGGGWPAVWAPRNVSAYDFNGDGLLDLVLTEGSYSNWNTGAGKLLILENKGKWRFADVTAKYGFPARGTEGMGLAIGDVNDDGIFDFFVADSNRLFVSGPGRRYRQCQPGYFLKPTSGDRDAHTCGAAFGDLNGDGRLDLVTTEHGQPSQIRVYLNRGINKGMPRFVNASREVGLGSMIRGTGKGGLPVKGAHVAVLDMDNDGLRDIVTSMLCEGPGGKVQPVVLRNLGVRGGIPRFSLPPAGRFVSYYAVGPVGDYDRDGRLDIFLPTWGQLRRRGRHEVPPAEPDIPSYLFRNVTDGGHWLTVRVAGQGKGLNPMGIGATVRAYKAGHAGDGKFLIDRHDISVGNGYASGEEALAPLGLGGATTCDVEITWGAHKKRLTGVKADEFLTVTFEGE